MLTNSKWSILSLIASFLLFSFPPEGESAQAYFMLNAECKNVYSCIGESHDISVICFNARCICDPRLGIYDPLRYKCVGRGDHACLGELCTRNAFCDVGNTCKCQPSYNTTINGRCVHGYAEECEENEDCKTSLTCSDGKCQCRDHHYYHAENDTCYSILKSLGGNSINAGIYQEPSLFHNTVEICVTLLQVGILVTIAVILSKLVNAMKGIADSIKRHGHVSGSGSTLQLQDQLQHHSPAGENIKMLEGSFFDGIETV